MDKIQNLDSVYRRTTEDSPITVRPYMITANDLAEIGHATCHWRYGIFHNCSSDVPEWLVNGWASCTEHLSQVVQAASHFNHNHRIWHDGQ